MDITRFLSNHKVIIILSLILIMGGCGTKKNVLPNNVTELGLVNNGAVAGSSQEFIQTVGNIIFFETDSSVIRPEAEKVLNQQATWLGQYSDKNVTIEGHTDERGTREYNLALGARRAAATRAYLISRGLLPSRIRTLSFGKERPIAVCDNESCWSQNRRAITILDGAGRQ